MRPLRQPHARPRAALFCATAAIAATLGLALGAVPSRADDGPGGAPVGPPPPATSGPDAAKPEDLAALVRGFKLVRRILDAPALAAFPSTELYTANVHADADIERAIRARADTVYHPVGTCRMGSDPGAVLDPELRVRGVERRRQAANEADDLVV